MNITYFTPLPETSEELKKMYRVLAFRHHPDRGGETAVMQAINAEYKYLFANLGSIHRNVKGEIYTKQTTEIPEDFIEIISQLIRLPGLIVEIIGSFIWVTGETKQHKDALGKDGLGFRWQPNKQAWYLAPEGWRKSNRKVFGLDEIRAMFGTQTVNAQAYGRNDLLTVC